MIQKNELGSNVPNLEATEAALVREIAIMLSDLEAGTDGELASEFAGRLLAYFRKHRQQILQSSSHVERSGP